MKGFQSFFRRVGLFFGVILISFLLFDQLVMRILNYVQGEASVIDTTPTGTRFDFCKYDPLLGFDGVPNLRRPFRGKMVTLNSDGNRSAEYHCGSGAQDKVFLLSGDSQAWGYDVDDEHTIGAQIERQLQAKDPLWHLVNLGVSGYGPDQSLLKYLLHGRVCHPKSVVFLLFLKNDLKDVGLSFSYGVEKPRFVLRGQELCLTNVPPRRSRGWPEANAKTRILHALPWLDSRFSVAGREFSLSKLQLLNFLSNREFRNLGGLMGDREIRKFLPCIESAPANEAFQEEDGVKLIGALLALFSKVVQEDGASFHVVLVPTEEELMQRSLSKLSLTLAEELRLKGLVIIDLLKERDIPENAVLPSSPTMWNWGGHLSEEGSRRAGDRILAEVTY